MSRGASDRWYTTPVSAREIQNTSTWLFSFKQEKTCTSSSISVCSSFTNGMEIITWCRLFTAKCFQLALSGHVPNHYTSCFVSVRPWCCEQRMVSIVCLANALTFGLWMDSTRTLRFFIGHCPPCVYHLST